MIRSLFLPDKIGSYYLFTNNHLGIEINKTHITAALVEKSGVSTKVKQIVDELIEQDHLTSYQERAAAALVNVINKIGKFDRLHTILPSSFVFFKEIQVPFTDYEKIKLIIGFEVEPLLPFPLHEVTIDFIITNQTADASTLLVAAIQKKVIEEHLEIFKNAHIQKPDVIAVDFLILYDLFLHNKIYPIADQQILVDFGSTTIRIGYINQKQLRQLRTINQGTTTIARTIADELHIAPTQAMEHLLRFGIYPDDHPDYVPAVQKALENACQAMRLTIHAFMVDNKVNIFLLGTGARIPGIDTFLSQQLKNPCSIIDPAQLLTHTTFAFKNNNGLTTSALVCIGVTTSSFLLQQGNFAKDEFAPVHEGLFFAQLITGISLCLLFFIILGGYAFFHLRSLNNEVAQAKNEAIDLLREQFPNAIDLTMTDLDEAVSAAQQAIGDEEKTWAKFSPEQRLSPLKYLLELTTAINKQATGLIIEQLTMVEKTMSMKGKVKDFEALTLLKEEIRQDPLFKIIPPEPNLPDFVLKLKLLSKPEQK